MVDLERARRRPSPSGAHDVPVLFEAVELSLGVVRGGWLAVAVLVVGAIGLAFRYSAGPGEMVGGLLAVCGVLVAFGLLRCRRFETTVGTSRVETRVGLAHRKLPLGMVTGVSVVAATSWRRAYAEREVRLEVAGGGFAIPTREPDELLEALGAPSGRDTAAAP